mgnify:CR=1 FL=1
MLIETLCDDEIVSKHEFDLKDYVTKHRNEAVTLKIEDSVAKSLSFNFEVLPVGEIAKSITPSQNPSIKRQLSLIKENNEEVVS